MRWSSRTTFSLNPVTHTIKGTISCFGASAISLNANAHAVDTLSLSMTTGPLVIFDLLRMTKHAAAFVMLPRNSYECSPAARRLEAANAWSDRLVKYPVREYRELLTKRSFS